MMSELHLRGVDSPTDEEEAYLHRPLARAEHIPVTLHRFASPSGPWPWSTGPSTTTSIPSLPSLTMRSSSSNEWRGYPQQQFPNWTSEALERSGLRVLIEREASHEAAVYTLDVRTSGSFVTRPTMRNSQLDEFWKELKADRPGDVLLRCYFVADVSGPILQMLGTQYVIEPFFFSSALNGISSRYQDLDDDEQAGDRITITLPFVRVIDSDKYQESSDAKNDEEYALVLDLQVPLALPSGKTLLLDQLAVHLVRNPRAPTLLTLHPQSEFWLTTSAPQLCARVRAAGHGIYWSRVWRRGGDPTLMLLVLMWHVLYAWDETMGALFDSALTSEKRAMDRAQVGEIEVTHELHTVMTALPFYSGLLKDFYESVAYILQHPNPNPNPALEGDASYELLKRECEHLLVEIRRLQDTKTMCQERLKDALDLVFRTLTVRDTKLSQSQTWVSQQITYLTTIFLPPTFIATVFGMNISILSSDTSGTLAEYLGISLPLIVVTVWLMLALRRHLRNPETPFYHQLLWPFHDLRDAWRAWLTPVHQPNVGRRARRFGARALERLKSRTNAAEPPQPRTRLRGWSLVRDRLPNIGGTRQMSLERVVISGPSKAT